MLSIVKVAKLQLFFWFLLVVAFIATYLNIYTDMSMQWSEDPNYSHGFLVPVISAYLIWQKKDALATLKIKPANSGLLFVLFGIAALFAGVAAQEYYLRRSSSIFILAGIILFLFGWQWFRSIWLPIGFLFFMIPLPYIVYDAIAFPLKLFVAKFSVISLKLMGVIVLREGNIIMFPNTVLEVADACSGLRSLMSLLALGVALAVLTQKRKLAMILLVVLTVPIAVLTNMIRVIITGYLAQFYGAAAAEGFFHEFAGMGVFLLAMVMLFMMSGVMRKLLN